MMVVMSCVSLLCLDAECGAQPKGESIAPPSVEGRIVWLAYDSRFESALNQIDEEIRPEGDSMKWNFFRGVVFWQEHILLDSAGIPSADVEASFLSSIQLVISAGESRLSGEPDDPEALFYTGFALGYRAKYDAAEGDKFKAASDGNKGLSFHKKLLTAHPEYYDAYFSLALFNFYTSALPWFLKPLLFILGKSGSEDKAYDYLWLAGGKGEFTRYAAQEILGELYARDKSYDSSTAVYQKLIMQFPDSRLYYYTRLSCILMDGKEYSRNVTECLSALSAVASMKLDRVDSLYLGIIQMRLAESCQYTGDYSEAQKHYDWIVRANRSTEAVRIARDRLADIQKR